MNCQLRFVLLSSLLFSTLSFFSQTCENCGIGTNTPLSKLEIKGCGTTSGTSALNITDNVGNSLLFIRDDGKLGVGTITPRSPLEVRVAGNNNLVQTGLIIQQTNPGVPNNSTGISLDFGIGNNGINNNVLGKIALRETYFGANPKMIFSLWDATPSNTMQDRMVLDYNGNLGIGTNSPFEKIDVNGGVKVGNTSTNNAGTIRWTGSDFEGYKTGGWVSLTGASGFWTPNGGDIYYNAGNVGIGTITPIFKLDVRSSGTATAAYMGLANSDGTKYIGMYNGANTNEHQSIFWTTGQDLKFGVAPNYSTAGFNELLRIKSNGNVGIGTTSPATKLDLVGAPVSVSGLLKVDATTATAFPLIRLQNFSGTGAANDVVGIWGDIRSTSPQAKMMRLDNNANTRFVIEVGGNVGIGTPTPQTTLDVNGGVSTRASNATVSNGNVVITVGNSSYIRVSVPATLGFSAQLTGGLQQGQQVTIEGAIGPGVFGLSDDDVLSGSSGHLRLSNGMIFQPGTNSTLSLIWNGTDWIETSRSEN